MDIMQCKYMSFIGENIIDIVLCVAKLCSFAHNIILIDLSSEKRLLDIAAPDGYSEKQNICFSEYNTWIMKQLEYFDLVIMYSEKVQNIPLELLKGDYYIFTSQRKHDMIYTDKCFKYLKNAMDNVHDINSIFVISRGVYINDNVKKIYIISTPRDAADKVFFINDNTNDRRVLCFMEYASIFLYDKLSAEMQSFFMFILKRVYSMFGIPKVPEVNRLKWVM